MSALRYDVIVIGGGASGVAAAIMLARREKKVLILESQDRILKKLLATGNGRCNFTNDGVSKERYNCDFAETAIGRFDYREAVSFFNSLGVLTANEEGREYPYSRQANTVVNAMLRELKRLGVTVLTESKAVKINKGFSVSTGNGAHCADNVIVATGSNATSGTLSYYLVNEFGHKVSICTPSLTYLKCDKQYVEGLSGIRIKAAMSASVKGRIVRRSGEILFKDNAVSGVLAFEFSSFFARREVDDGYISIDMLDKVSDAELEKVTGGDFSKISETLEGLLPRPLAELIAKKSGTNELRAKRLLRDYRIPVTGLGDIKNAQVVSGGLLVKDFDKETMESRFEKGLYAIGEVLDVDGECGGYNLHWAWASANAAVKKISGENNE